MHDFIVLDFEGNPKSVHTAEELHNGWGPVCQLLTGGKIVGVISLNVGETIVAACASTLPESEDATEAPKAAAN